MYEIYCLFVLQNANLQNSDLVECVLSSDCPKDRPKCSDYGHCVLGKNLEILTLRLYFSNHNFMVPIFRF